MKLTKHFFTKNLKFNPKVFFSFLILIMLFSFSLYFNYRYNSLLTNFKTNFDNYNFSEANSLILNNESYNPLKPLFITKDLSTYFSTKLTDISNDYKNQNISEEDVLLQLKEIDRYSIVSKNDLMCVSNLIDSSNNSTESYNNAMQYYSDGDYSNAIKYFKEVSPLDINYSSSLIYITNSKDKIKETLFSTCDELSSKDYYTKAINLLTDNISLIGNSSDVALKISELKEKQQEYYNKISSIAEASSSALTSEINPSNVNTLNIQSNTKYFLNVNLDNQKTYIYKGNSDNWNLIRTCPCSTGIDSEVTPSGSFCTQEKGTWFFSDKYDQGGKYWTQITGDILFHSVPYARDKSTVLDYTLNTPASHGCIRLSLDDAKWIYTNIPKGSKIIIK